MKLLTFRRPDGVESWGILKNEGVVDLVSRAPGLKHALWAMTSLAEEAARHADFRLDDVTLLPPIPNPDKILCVGLNYISHIKEGGREPPPKPIIFTRTRIRKSVTASRWCGRTRHPPSTTKANSP